VLHAPFPLAYATEPFRGCVRSKPRKVRRSLLHGMVGQTLPSVNARRCCANSSFRIVPQLRSSCHRSSSARVIKEMPSRRPARWMRYGCARESPLNNIDTTSVSIMAAFTALGWRFRGAIRAASRRTHRPIRPRRTDARARHQSPSRNLHLGVPPDPQAALLQECPCGFWWCPSPLFQHTNPSGREWPRLEN